MGGPGQTDLTTRRNGGALGQTWCRPWRRTARVAADPEQMDVSTRRKRRALGQIRLSLCTCDVIGAFGGARHQLAVLREHAGLVARRAGPSTPPGGASTPAAGISRSSTPRFGVDRDRVAFVHRRDRAAVERLRRDVADHEAARGAAEAAVGDSATVSRQSRADDRAGHAEHLAHAGAAARPFVADHHHVAGLDLAVGDRLPWRPLRGRRRAPGPWWTFLSCPASLITQPSGARLPRRITRPPRGLSGLSSGRITSWPGVSSRLRRFFGEGAAGDGHAPSRRRSRLPPGAARSRGMPPALSTSAATYRPPGLRSTSSGVRALIGSKSSIVERHAGLARHGQQVQHRVGRAAGGGDAGDGVVEGLRACRCRAAGCSLRTASMITSPQRYADVVLARDRPAGRRRCPSARGRSTPSRSPWCWR